MTISCFSAGQRVRYLPSAANIVLSQGGNYTIIRQMPDGRSGLTYRIKGDGEMHERVAPESDLELVW